MGFIQHQGFKAREERTKVRLRARMQTSTGWVDAFIRDVSTRGMMIESETSPKVGSYVEVRRGRNVVVARVVWHNGQRFGIRSQDRISLAALYEDPELSRPPRQEATAAFVERRRSDRESQRRSLAAQAERSQAISRVIQFTLMSAAVATAAFLIGSVVFHTLNQSFGQVTRALSGAEKMTPKP